MQRYLRVPESIRLADLPSQRYSWSPGMYRRVIIPTNSTLPVRDLLDNDHPYSKGSDPGSIWYLDNSSWRLIRTKALQEHSFLIYPKGGSITGISKKVFLDQGLSDGDILLSKDSNIGECAMVDGDGWANCMLSAGIVRIQPIINRFYLFAFLKHRIFTTQLNAMVPRGATIKHANELWMDCMIPIPEDGLEGDVGRYVAALCEAIIMKERMIRERSSKIDELIEAELTRGAGKSRFEFQHPRIGDVMKRSRLDAAIYDREFKSKIWKVNNYSGGSVTPSEAGFVVIPGPSLEMKLLKTRIDSEDPVDGYYQLVIPTNISEYGTISKMLYMGTKRSLPLLKAGDVLFGEAGFHKGRSVVFIEQAERVTTNAHGLVARRTDGDIEASIYFRCIFNWYRASGLIDLMAVGGSGGHFSPEYFDSISIPEFPSDIRESIVRQYHNEAPPPKAGITINSFVAWHNEWNASLGIWQLDREMNSLLAELRILQEKIIDGAPIELSYK